MKRKLLSVLTALALCLGLLPGAALAWYPYCECDAPVDEAPHDHYCDVCGGIEYYLDDLNCSAEGCDAWETTVNGEFAELNYESRGGEILVSGQVSVRAKAYDSADPWENQIPAAGSVSLSWGEGYTTGDVALDEHGTAVISFAELPLEDLERGGDLLYRSADAAKYLPSANGLVVEFAGNLFEVAVDTNNDFTINGMEENYLHFLPGTEITLTLEVGESAQGACVWTFDEDETVPEYVADGVSITFAMPAGDVAVGAEFVCDVCADEDGDHWCDSCVTQISQCVDEDGDHWCDLCWENMDGLCFDEDNDHSCDVCWSQLKWLCIDENGDHVCDICCRVMDELCFDENEDHRCDVCEYSIEWLCYDEDHDHYCDLPVCDNRLSWCDDLHGDYTCDFCGGPVYPSAGELDVETESGDGSITVTWKPVPVQIGEDTLAFYTVYCFEEENGSYEEAVTAVYPPAEATFTHTFTGLTNDVTYEVGVVMTYTLDDGGSGPYEGICASVEVPVPANAAAPAAPEIVGVSYGEGSITLEWTAPEYDGGAKLRGFWAHISNEEFAWGRQVPVETLAEGETYSTTFDDLVNGECYHIGVSAYNAVGEGQYAWQDVTIPLIPYIIEVGGVRVTGENMHDVLGDGTVSYDPQEHLLVLNNASIEVADGSYGILTDVPLTIELEGENFVLNSGLYGILARNALTIRGEGLLCVSGSDFGIYTEGYPDATLTVCGGARVSATSGDVAFGGSYGIRADGVFTVCEGAEVNASAGRAPGRSCGIYAYTRLNVLDDAVVTTIAGNAENDSYGIRTTDITVDGGILIALGGDGLLQSHGIYTQGLEILGGEIFAEGAAVASGPSVGLQVTKDLVVSGEDPVVTALGGSVSGGSSSGIIVGGLMVVGNGQVTATGGDGEYSHGMDLYELVVNGGCVTAGSGASTSEEGFCWGIQTGALFELNGGTVTAAGGDGGWRSYGVQSAELMDITGGTLKASSGSAEGSYALWSFQQPVLGGKMAIRTPARGKLDNSGEWFWTISKNGTAADEVEIGRRTPSPHPSASAKPEPGQQERVDSCTDVDSGAWYYEAVKYVLNEGVMDGVDGESFAPAAAMDRATLVTVLWNLAGQPKSKGEMRFADVSADAGYAQAVKWAASKGIVAGVGEGSFAPDATLTREQLATILYAYEKANGGGFTGAWMFLLDYPDRASVAEWAYEPMCWMTMKGVIGGKDAGVLAPKAEATRAEAAQMLMRYLKG